MYAFVTCSFDLPGIREYVAAQRVNSSLTIVRRHSMDYMDNHMQRGNSNTGETFVVNIPFLDNEELDEFHDANMDQLSEWSEVLSKYQNTSPAGCIMRTSCNPRMRT
jgi:hypothetical protein